MGEGEEGEEVEEVGERASAEAASKGDGELMEMGEGSCSCASMFNLAMASIAASLMIGIESILAKGVSDQSTIFIANHIARDEISNSDRVRVHSGIFEKK